MKPVASTSVRRETSKQAELSVSVIVPVRNHASGVERLLARMRSQTLGFNRFELIIADDGSRQRLSNRLDGWPEWVRFTSGPRSNAYVARNRATKLARGSVLAFTDADCLPQPDWLARGIEALQHADLVAGHIESVFPAKLSGWAVIDALLFDQERFVSMGKAATANLFVPRALFEHQGGFDPRFPSGGDWEFVERCVRADARLVYAPKAVVQHTTRNRADEFLRRRWRVEHSMARRLGERGVPLLKLNVPREPVVPRRLGFIVGYDERRLTELGVPAGTWTRLRTLPARSFLIPLVEGVAQVTGWVRGRLRTRARTTPRIRRRPSG